MATEQVVTPTRPADVGLRRRVGPIGLAWASLGSIIGSGWLFGSLKAGVAAGTAAILAWIICALIFIVFALVHSELGAMYPVAGGTARFPHYAFGSFAGASFGWFGWLQAALVAPVEVLATLSYGSVHLTWLTSTDAAGNPVPTFPRGYLICIGLLGVFTLVNFLGVRWLSHTNSAFTWWKLAIPILIIIVFATKFHGANFGSHGGFAPFGAKGVFAAISTAGVAFALLGFEQADQLAGEAIRPQKDIPRGIISAMLIGALIYILLQVFFIGALEPSSLAHGWSNLSYKGDAGPFAGLATALGLGWLATIVYIDAIISPGGTGLIYTTSTSRLSYGLSRNGYVPAVFERTDRRGVPWFSLLFTFLVGIIIFLPFPSWQDLIEIITAITVLMYAGAPLAFGALRKQVPDQPRPFRLGLGNFWAPVSFVLASFIIYWAGWQTIWKLGLAIVLGYILLGMASAFRMNPHAPKFDRSDWKAAAWLPTYLIGLGIISWQGTFGDGSAGNLPLWWDLLTIAIFSLVIYYWAQRVRLPVEKVKALIAAQTEVNAGEEQRLS